MARLNSIVESDDEFPELSAILQSCGEAKVKHPATTFHKQCTGNASPRKEEPKEYASKLAQAMIESESIAKVICDERKSSKQGPLGPLKPANLVSLRFPVSSGALSSAKCDGLEKQFPAADGTGRSSPRRKIPVDYSKFVSRLSDARSSLSEDDDSFTDLSGFIVPDSASDEEVLPTRVPHRRNFPRSTEEATDHPTRYNASTPQISPTEGLEDSELINLNSPKKQNKTFNVICPESPPGFKTLPKLPDRAGALFDLDEPFADLKFSPPRSKSPYKSKEGSRPVTPSSSPSNPKLQSPSKSHRIPPSSHRPSIDAFWSHEVINDWNEQYSPKKTLQSPRKFGLYSVDKDDENLSPSESPRKSPIKSPSKKDNKEIALRKEFNEKKHKLATSFLAEVDQTVGKGQVAALTESTGGIKIIWSKKLSSTAGRANWKRETVRSKTASETVSATTHRHHASIELAEKVIDDEDRLINVLAHEYCHLANFMISGIKDNPHGKDFKDWARKCTRAFSDRNIKVTTKHSYTIAYKYIWSCISPGCGLEYKRHSKSIDPAKHSCGSCKGKLVQIQPAPRKGEGQGKRSEYQEFVKREHERVRKQNLGAGFGEIMAILGREFRESKKKFAVVEGREEKGDEDIEEQVEEGVDLDDVARKLDFLKVEA